MSATSSQQEITCTNAAELIPEKCRPTIIPVPSTLHLMPVFLLQPKHFPLCAFVFDKVTCSKEVVVFDLINEDRIWDRLRRDMSGTESLDGVCTVHGVKALFAICRSILKDGIANFRHDTSFKSEMKRFGIYPGDAFVMFPLK